MATGYETRQGGRDTFASQAPAMQSIGGRVALAGGGQGAQIVGGNATGGAPNANITAPAPMAGDLGEFFGEAVKPYLERVQNQKFFEGMARAQAGESIDELSTSHKNLVGQVFGPTAFEKGAQAYTAIQKVNDWEKSVTDNMDDWVKLSPEDQGKRLSDQSMSMMGEDPFVNQMVQKEIIQRTGPLLDTINKARFKYQQDTFHDSQYNALNSAADNLQSLAVASSKVNDPSDKTAMAGVDTAVGNLSGLFVKPEGMTDDTYKGTLTDFLNGAAQRGNFYAYNALVSRGALEAIGSDNAAKVLTSYDRWSKVGLAEAKGNHVQEVLAIAEKTAKRQLSPLQASAAYDAINAKISQETGIKERAYDSDKLVSAGTSVIDQLAADMKQQATWAHEDRVRINERALDKADKAAEEAQKGADARAAMAGGFTGTALATGAVDSTATNVSYLAAYKNRNFDQLSSNADHGYTNDAVKTQITAQLNSAHGQAYTGEAKEAYETWQQWSKKDINGAIAYYGTQNSARLMNMDRMIASGEPASQAYLFSFADTDPTKYAPIALTGHEMSVAQKAVESAVDSQGSGFLGRMFGGAPMAMTATTRNLLINETFRDVGVLTRGGSHEPPEVLAGAAVKKALSDGHLEIHGGSMSWLNPANSQTMPNVVKMNPESFRNTLRDVVEHKFKASGITAGVDGEYDVQRIGNDLLVWSAADGKIVHVSPQDIINEHRTHATRKASAVDATTGTAYKQPGAAADNPIYHHKGSSLSELLNLK